MKVFLDTNVLISAYTARGICADLLRYILSEHELLTGEVNLAELRRVLRDRFKAPQETIATIETGLRDETIVAKPKKPSPLPIRDPDDRWVLASAVEGGADLLVTGDQDLLAVARQSPLTIVDPRGCWDHLRALRE
ncbi:MAG TPA: putative toxin-antitoxin system toxin component, PIN family [Nitrospira sp.]|nr:putative toxin-antitoxin system toxin component, PIN family [Nitrospira sp.]